MDGQLIDEVPNQPTNQVFFRLQPLEFAKVGLEVQNLIPKNLNHQSLGSTAGGGDVCWAQMVVLG